MKRVLVVLVVVTLLAAIPAALGYAADKIGVVDARRALYSYEKTKEFETEMNGLTEKWQATREQKVEAIKKLRDETEMLSGDAKTKKQLELEGKIADLNESDRNKRQELLAKQNDMFRVLTEDINKVVADVAKKEQYDIILDSRTIVYKKEGLDLTEQVIEKLNK